jgi:protein phosphatase
MLSWRKFPLGGLQLVTIALCLAFPACSNNNGQPKDNKLQEQEVNPAAKAMKLSIGQCTRIGKFRESNGDAIAVEDLGDSTLCLAAHGFGGKVGDRELGPTASQRALSVFAQELKKTLPDATTAEDNQKAIRQAIVATNKDIMALGAKDPNMVMGTTVVLALWRQDKGMYIAGVGDSRAYVVRSNKLEQLTVDHSLAQALLESKTITAEEARTHRFRNVLWKYLGSKEVGDGPEVKVVPLQPRDRILLCTAGVHTAVPDEHLLLFMRQHAEVQQCADGLCQFALDAGSRNNVSCIVIEMVENQVTNRPDVLR